MSQDSITIYRNSTIGLTLKSAIQDMIDEGKLNQDMSDEILEQFDKSIIEGLSTQIKNRISFKGKCHTYRFVDNVYFFLLQNATFKVDQETLTLDKVKIVAMEAKKQSQDDEDDGAKKSKKKGGSSSSSGKGKKKN